MSTPTPNIPVRHRADRGFSMLEVLFALMILGLGLIAVAAIFPVAGTLQRETLDDIHSEQVAHSVSSLVYGRGFSRAYTDQPPTVGVHAFEEEMLTDPDSALGALWLLGDRAYPSFIADGINGGELVEVDPYTDRYYYWVPLYQYRQDGTFRAFVFLLRNERSAWYRFYLEEEHLADPSSGWDADEDAYRIPIVQRYDPGDAGDDAINVRADGNNVRRIIEFDFGSETFIPTLDLGPGVQFLDNHGTVHTVQFISGPDVYVAGDIEAGQEPDYIWYAPPSEKGRVPTRRILTFGSEVIR